MKGSRKTNPPEAFTDWLVLKNENWEPTYGGLSGKPRTALVGSLFEEQRGLCVYCGRKLDMSKPGKTFHVEHFRHQDGYPELALDHQNLFLSCGQEEGYSSQICGAFKGNNFSESNCVEPVYPDVMERFKFTTNGAIVPVIEKDAAAEAMIGLLNLNHEELQKDRKDRIADLDNEYTDDTDYYDQSSHTCSSFAHMAFQRLNKTIP